MKRVDGAIRLIIIEDLECVIQDRFDDSDLPPCVGDVAAGVGAHEGWSREKLVYGLVVRLYCGVETYPKQIARLPAFIRFWV